MATALQLETAAAGVRSAALSSAPIEVRSALDRTSRPLVIPGRSPDPVPPAAASHSTDDEAPEWPDDAMEAAMSAEAAAREGQFGGQGRRKSRAAAVETLDGGPLPDLHTLLATIPSSLQTALDELFRAKFQSVRRVPPAVLKATTATAEADATRPAALDDAPELVEGEVEDD